MSASPPHDPPFFLNKRSAVSDRYPWQGQKFPSHTIMALVSFLPLNILSYRVNFFYVDLNVSLYTIKTNHRRIGRKVVKISYLFCAFLRGRKKNFKIILPICDFSFVSTSEATINWKTL